MAEDYSFMKSGFDNISEEGLDRIELIKQYLFIGLFMENALTDTELYIEHSNRDI
jgi:hypothetical protein